MVYSDIDDCKERCDEVEGCMSFAACPVDGNKCYLKYKSMDENEPSRDVGRNCVTFFVDEESEVTPARSYGHLKYVA